MDLEIFIARQAEEVMKGHKSPTNVEIKNVTGFSLSRSAEIKHLIEARALQNTIELLQWPPFENGYVPEWRTR